MERDIRWGREALQSLIPPSRVMLILMSHWKILGRRVGIVVHGWYFHLRESLSPSLIEEN